jgi:ABC-type iron transport system FetAB permease component
MSVGDFKEQLYRIKDGLINVVEKKVIASSTTAAVTGLVLAYLSTYVFKGHVPDLVITLVDTVVVGGATFLAGFLAKHTHRTVLEPATPAVPPATPEVPPDNGRSL